MVSWESKSFSTPKMRRKSFPVFPTLGCSDILVYDGVFQNNIRMRSPRVRWHEPLRFRTTWEVSYHIQWSYIRFFRFAFTILCKTAGTYNSRRMHLIDSRAPVYAFYSWNELYTHEIHNFIMDKFVPPHAMTPHPEFFSFSHTCFKFYLINANSWKFALLGAHVKIWENKAAS